MNLEVRKISKSIKDNIILKDISFQIRSHDIVGFIGNNGAGKTTTIKSIFQEIKVQSGEIIVDDKLISVDDLKKIEFFPDQNNFPKNYSVKSYCKYNFLLSNPNKKEKEFQDLYIKIMNALGLEQHINSKFSQLSSGMQKKALLAMVLINKPKIIFLDEPTANLDVQTRIEFIDLLKNLVDQIGMSIFITSHDINELQTFVNRIIFIKKGELVLDQKYDSNIEDLNKIYNDYFGDDKKMINSEKIKEALGSVS